MFPAVIHEGEIVETPTRRQWIVMGWEAGHTHVLLRDPLNDEEVALRPGLLRHISSAQAGDYLDAVVVDDEKPV